MSNPDKHPAVGASRSIQGGNGYNALSPAYETRKIKIAYGIQFHKDESLSRSDVTAQQFMDKHLQLSADLEKISDSEYINHLQGVRYAIEETTSKQQFVTWLKTPDLHVVYMGHARYGRGPCFGAHGLDPANPGSLMLGEDWEEGTDGDSGIFRMGYPYVGADANEILAHGYTARLLKESEGRPARSDCDPDLARNLGTLVARAPNDIESGIAAHLRDHRNGDRYWSYGPKGRRHVVHHAGWRKTFSAPSELGALQDPGDPDATQMLCRVFAHLGCSTYVHNYPVVRKIAKWTREGNERYAYWTTDLSGPPYAVGPWVAALISYDQWNAFQSWSPSLAWAVQRANRWIRQGKGGRYRII